MRHFRAIGKIVILLVATALIYAAWLIGRIFCIGSSSRRHLLRRKAVRAWSVFTKRIIGLRIECIGTPPEPPFFFVANHVSYVDALLMLNYLDGVLVARGDVRYWPLIGHLAWLSETLFIDRSKKKDVVRVSALFEGTLSQGDGIILFPEGRTTDGASVGTFRTSLFEFAATRKMPVHYASITYCTEPHDPPATESICWWGDMTFLDHLYALLTIRRFTARIHFGLEPVVAANRKDLSAQIKENIERNFIPVTRKVAI